ncbi:MAG: aldo/keto reductase [Anaerolineaceae bacterium]|nr:aldo/keto reductase [Anaerolineaceae bacterium]
METRRFGRSGHRSSIAIFGGAAFHPLIDAAEAEEALDLALAAGVNHYDFAAGYGNGMAETRLGPWLERHREQVFVGTKTVQRAYAAAWAEINRSLALLRCEPMDLAQIHGVVDDDELDAATAADGALKAMCRARDEGLTRFIGITGHGLQAPRLFCEALERFDFDSVLFPINPVLFGIADYRRHAERLLARCQERDVGVMAIKSIAKGPWGDRDKRWHTWYEPWETQDRIQQGVNFALSQPGVSGIPMAGETRLLPLVLQAAEDFTPLSLPEQESLIAASAGMEAIFA